MARDSKKDDNAIASIIPDNYDEEVARKVVSMNLRKIQEAARWTQRDFADKIGMALAAANGYLNGATFPPIKVFILLRMMQELKEKNIFFTIDDLILNPDYTPFSQTTQGDERLRPHGNARDHRDFLGTYLTYVYDQTKSEIEGASRKLRYGVINVYENYNTTGEEAFITMARFFKEDEKEKAFQLKKNIDSFYKENLSHGDLMARIKEVMQEKSGYYSGMLSFGEGHVFISLSSIRYNDQALIVLYSPKKKADKDYIGGLGCVSSVARVREHMPAAQKIILSRYEIKRSKEEIGSYLRLLPSSFTANDETMELIQLFKRLYSAGEGYDIASQFLNERDKQAIFDSRLHQLIRNYIEKNAFCVATVSEIEDVLVYSLIKQFAE